jgi:NADH-quinone oxidoreductase subunit H
MQNKSYVYLGLLVSQSIGLILGLLISVAYMTLAERKLIASIQRRRGPNVIGYIGLLQPLSDGLKLFVKESLIPSNVNKFYYLLAPVWTFFLSMLAWAVIPFSPGAMLADIDLGIFFLFAISSLAIYGVILAGWASNSKYSFLGSLRSAAQIVAYELPIGIIFLVLVLSTGSINLSHVVIVQSTQWFCIPHLPLFGVFLVSILAETNRHPFDLPEAESELVSGYNTEYGGISFALFFLGEYLNILLICGLTTILFIGGWLSPITGVLDGSLWFSLKTVGIVCFFIFIRCLLPRYRYDQLIGLGWKVFLPLTLGWYIFTLGNLGSLNSLPF